MEILLEILKIVFLILLSDKKSITVKRHGLLLMLAAESVFRRFQVTSV